MPALAREHAAPQLVGVGVEDVVVPRRGDEPVLALEQLRGGYSHLRPALHAVLDTVGLRGASSADDELLATLKRVRAARERFVDEPVELLPKTWRAWVLDDDGRVQRTRYELGLWFVARDALRAGRLYGVRPT